MARLVVGDSPARLFPSAGSVPVVPAAGLAAWSLFVWGGRLRNLLAEPGGLGELTGGDRWSLIGSLLFGVLALATLVTLMVARRFTVVPATVLAVLGIAVWAYRGVVILGRDYSAGFMAVHTILAGISIGLGLWCLRSMYGLGGRATQPGDSL
ncbi:MAG: hypothetical protein OES24_18525 [Acidimicrobiia bacterium]|nr:hypothetical protein [Acidimicrobiia bacterium]